VIVLPSRTLHGKWKEQFGHVLIEAMAMGIPVIGSNSGAIPEVIGRSDLIFPENDSEELSLILGRLIADNEWLLEVSKFLENRAINEYSDQKIADLLVSIWRDIIPTKK
jgi:glycosyltransferase involved in cell wall biosynthesis